MASNKDLTVVYLTHNRKYYTGMTLPRVIDECKRSKRFNKLIVFDDDSKDGTLDIFEQLAFPSFTSIVSRKVGNSVDQFNYAVQHTEDQYIYYLGNDILLPYGIFDSMCEFMDGQENVISAMVQECKEYPALGNHEWEEHTYTSSLGIHRKMYFEAHITSGERFFGFGQYQGRLLRANPKLTVARMQNISNTNLDMACWGKQMEYAKLGYSRTGLVSPEKNVWK